MAKITVVTAGQGVAIPTAALVAAGHEVTVARGFQEAVALLKHHSPDVLISELQLGMYNGLHLAIRHRTSHPMMRCVILSQTFDPVLAAEARACGATYGTIPADDRQLVELVTGQLAEKQPPRRWPRKRPADPLVVKIADRSALVLDLSYGGMRLETQDLAALPGPLEIIFPESGIAISAEAVWSQPGPVGSWWFGATVAGLEQSRQQEWRQLVDAVGASA